MKKFLILSLLVFCYTAHSYEMESIVNQHYDRVEKILDRPVTISQRQMALLIKKLAKNNINDNLANYFALRPQMLINFRKSSLRAREYSIATCASTGDGRHTDDEVDAMRHVLWSAYLTHLLGKTVALNITSLQETNTGNNPHAMRMDLWNNFVAIDYVSKMKKELFFKTKSQVKNIFINLALSLLKKGKLKVLQSYSGTCAQPDFYPNL